MKYFLLTVVLFSWIAVFQALHRDLPYNKCRCQSMATNCVNINPKAVKEVQIIPKTALCHRTEILITRKNNTTICLHPNAPCIKKAIEKFVK
ncbi:alveolar macrophage chemotactic factor [Scleropages formosus]|uniref:alveolar macrophage chemotactic factor n=1 Tax=Scleropages formosus TaxID=113540 RepID=UPI000878ADFD|nr:alveolar macrophage chemotactic factor-like [Scleropages formosus]